VLALAGVLAAAGLAGALGEAQGGPDARPAWAAGAGAVSHAITDSAGPPKGAAGQQTDPHVRPRGGTPRTHFVAFFTVRDVLGHRGVLATDYRLQVDAPKGARASCAPPQPPIIATGRQGTVTRVALRAPAHGWCAGRHTVIVFLQRGPYCPPPAPGKPPTACPLFASQDLEVGAAQFTVSRSGG